MKDLSGKIPNFECPKCKRKTSLHLYDRTGSWNRDASKINCLWCLNCNFEIKSYLRKKESSHKKN